MESKVDPNTGTWEVGIRCYDSPEGQMMAGHLESPNGWKGFSLGHRYDPNTGEIIIDEVSHCTF